MSLATGGASVERLTFGLRLDYFVGMAIDIPEGGMNLDVLKVRRQWIVDAIEKPDQIEVVTDPSGTRHLVVLKKSPTGTLDYWGLLVRAHEDQNSATVKVDDVLKVPADMMSRIDPTPTPLGVLEAMAERFGVPVSVAHLNQKFILSIKTKAMGTGVRAIGVPHGFQGSAMVTMTPYESDGEQYVELVFGYGIDMRVYLPTVGLRWPFA